MIELLEGDLYRLGKSKLLRGMMVLAGVLSLLLTMTMRRDIRVGISVLGNLTAFKGIADVIRIGTEYEKGLGILAAILISVFIGQEYQWKTWQHKWIIKRSRARIYLSKAILSSGVSAAVFLVFESIALLSSGQINSVLTGEYITLIVCGSAMYSALGACICFVSMLIKNNVTSIITCLFYILFTETIWSIIQNVSRFSFHATEITELAMQHSLYGMSTIISSTPLSVDMTIGILINSVAIIFMTTLFGLTIFGKYEL